LEQGSALPCNCCDRQDTFTWDCVRNPVITEPETAVRDDISYIPVLCRVDPETRNLDATLEEMAHATHVITGGTGSLGLSVAGLLVNQSPSHVSLLSRYGKVQSVSTWSLLCASESHITIHVSDVASVLDLEVLSNCVGNQTTYLVHSAGALADAWLQNQTSLKLAHVWSPKVQGTVALRECSLTAKSTFLFSSASGLLGNIGQCNYAAANAYLDAVAKLCCSPATPWVSIQWSAWAGDGMASKVSSALESHGMHLITHSQGLSAFEWCTGASIPPVLAVLPLDWNKSKLGSSFGPSFLPPAMQSKVGHTNENGSEQIRIASQNPFVGLDSSAKTAYLESVVAETLTTVSAEAMKPDEAIADVLDSLSAVQFQTSLAENLGGIELPSSLVFEHPSPPALVAYLMNSAFVNSMPLPDLPLSANHAPASHVAVTGKSCRLPGKVESSLQFFNVLLNGETHVNTKPPVRYAVLAAEHNLPSHFQTGGFMDDLELVDLSYFSLSLRAVKRLDPHARVLMELVSAALLDSPATWGIQSATKDSIGLFVAALQRDFILASGNVMSLALWPVC